ncbi:MAG: NAD-binding protein [Actinomycetota bacterium]|nr:NAD-binding protein [Actinomycetota bacterium]
MVGYGTKGRSATRALLDDGYPAERIVVVDAHSDRVAEAISAGLSAVCGDATRSEVLRQAQVGRAERVLVAAQRDDTAVLVVLTVRQQNGAAQVVAAVRGRKRAAAETQRRRQRGRVVGGGRAADRAVGHQPPAGVGARGPPRAAARAGADRAAGGALRGRPARA